MSVISQQFIDPSSRWNAADYNKPIGPIARIIDFVAREYGTTPAKLKDISSPNDDMAEARHVARWLAYHASGKSSMRIAYIFRCKPVSVMYAVHMIEARLESDPGFKTHLDDLLARTPR